MGLSSIYNKIALFSPYCEIALRHLYWKNVKWLGKFNPNKAHPVCECICESVDFQDVINYLKTQGIGEGSLLIVHSSMSQLECTGLTAEQIIDRLLELVGTSGTLAMPAIRKYKGAPKGGDILKTDLSNKVFKYNTRKTLVSSGLLPYTMVKRKDSKVSLHPLNPMVAIGPLAGAMMEHNIEGVNPSPHGPNSSWKFCYDHDAYVIGLGVDLNHYNTISHINEEAFGNWKWADNEWYRLRKFEVTDDAGKVREITVSERKPEWGMLRFAEINANKDRNDSGLITRKKIGSVVICVEKAKKYIDHLQQNNKQGKYFYI